ncbi:hypothetical protein N9N28_16155 [Rubripirellula amarantea]|nr:hypothetical protein [Rubripirellula amarantea]
MSPTNSPQPDERLSEELVAYLDGELSPSESESVETRIQQDEHARNELQKFDRVWNTLDELPRAVVDAGFTRTTIEMAAVEAKKELAHETSMLPVRRRHRWLKIASLAAAAGLVGFAALAVLTPNPNRELYSNLPVILQLDAYSEVRDIEFLRLLEAEAGGWLLAEWGPEVESDAADLATLTTASYAQRRKYVDELPEDRRTDLAAKHRRYESLTPEMRTELAQRHTTLATDPDAAKLQETMLAYYGWVSREDEVDQAQLRMLEPQERVARVQLIQREASRRDQFRLAPSDAVALSAALDKMALDPQMKRLHQAMVNSLPNVDKLPDRLPSGLGERLGKFKSMSPQLAIRMVLWVAASGRSEPLGPAFAAYRNAIEQRMIEALGDETAARLPDDPLARTRRLTGWMFEASRRQDKPDVATLMEFFINGDLSEEVRQQLLAMPRDQMLESLERLYVEEFLGEGSIDREFRDMMQDFGRGGWFGGRRGRGDRDGRRSEDRGSEDRGSDDLGPEGRGPQQRGPEGRGEGQRGERGPRGERPGPEGPPGDFGPPPPPRGEGPMP